MNIKNIYVSNINTHKYSICFQTPLTLPSYMSPIDIHSLYIWMPITRYIMENQYKECHLSSKENIYFSFQISRFK